MNPREKIYEHDTFDDEHLICPNCGWNGDGYQAHVAGFYGIGKYKEVMCPQCSEYLGNLLRESSSGEGRSDSQIGPR